MPNVEMPPMPPVSKEEEDEKAKYRTVNKRGEVKPHKNLHEVIEETIEERES